MIKIQYLFCSSLILYPNYSFPSLPLLLCPPTPPLPKINLPLKIHCL